MKDKYIVAIIGCILFTLLVIGVIHHQEVSIYDVYEGKIVDKMTSTGKTNCLIEVEGDRYLSNHFPCVMSIIGDKVMVEMNITDEKRKYITDMRKYEE